MAGNAPKPKSLALYGTNRLKIKPWFLRVPGSSKARVGYHVDIIGRMENPQPSQLSQAAASLPLTGGQQGMLPVSL